MERQHGFQGDTQEVEKEHVTKGLDGVQRAKQQVQHPNPPAASPSTTSPSHEFSFTISLHPGKNKPPPLAAVDLSPADEIFFHGHLLPLHLLSHLHVSPPRSSTDSSTLPMSGNNKLNDHMDSGTCPEKSLLEGSKEGGTGKSKSFSLFGLPKRRKDENMFGEGQKGKTKFDMTRFLERYIKPFIISLRNRRRNDHMQRQSYSFPGNLKQRSKGMRGRREFSAPASMGNSRTNSGLLVGSGNITPNNNKSDSTMEELQAAIQAAIAHCKNSVAEDKNNKLP